LNNFIDYCMNYLHEYSTLLVLVNFHECLNVGKGKGDKKGVGKKHGKYKLYLEIGLCFCQIRKFVYH